MTNERPVRIDCAAVAFQKHARRTLFDDAILVPKWIGVWFVKVLVPVFLESFHVFIEECDGIGKRATRRFNAIITETFAVLHPLNIFLHLDALREHAVDRGAEGDRIRK